MIQRFERLTGIAAPLVEANLDTDIVFPARFLLITARHGLGRYAFHDRRFDADGAELPGFVLNREPWRGASILIAGDNFGCGSSREQAVWALLGFGIRCIVASSFGEIFHANCVRNGVLPIVLPPADVAGLAETAAGALTLTVDLTACTIDGIGFDIAPEQRLALLEGWDDTALIVARHGDAVAAFEAGQRLAQPWLYAMEPAR